MDTDILARLLDAHFKGSSPEDSFADLLYQYMHSLNQGQEKGNLANDIQYLSPDFRTQMAQVSKTATPGLDNHDLNINQSRGELADILRRR